MEKKINEASRLLVHEEPLLVLPKLAEEIGLNEAIFLQQVHYWLEKSKYIYDGRKWVYNTYIGWTKQFPFWSLSTVRRIVEKLERSGLLLADNYNIFPMDNTKWYSIDYHLLNKMTSTLFQHEQSPCSNNEIEYPQLNNNHVQLGQNKLAQPDLSNTRELPKTTTEIVVDKEKNAPQFDHKGMPTSQGATSALDADSSQKKISLATYRKKVIDKYNQRRNQGLTLSTRDLQALETIVAERIPLRIALQGIDKAFDTFKPAHKRDKINSLNYCVQVIFQLYHQSKSQQETSSIEQSSISDTELQGLLARMKSGGDEHEEYNN